MIKPKEHEYPLGTEKMNRKEKSKFQNILFIVLIILVVLVTVLDKMGYMPLV